MTHSTYRLGVLAMATIVALRVGIGMHFFMEGTAKLKSDKPYSRYFLESAKGPLASTFHAAVWDREGRDRLGYALDEEYGQPEIDLTPTSEAWDLYRTQIVDHYGLGEDERAEAQLIVKQHEDQLKWYLGIPPDARRNPDGTERHEEVLQYFRDLERVAELQADAARQDVDSLWRQSQSITAEMKGKRDEWLWQIDQIWNSLERELNELGAETGGERLSLTRLGRRPLDSEAVDKIIPWFDVIVGALLVVGLFTRLAAFSGGLFLAAVCLSQWPTAIGAQPIWYQLIEMLACFALVGLAAGRFAGLDSILHNIRLWCCPPKEHSENPSRSES